ncbi:MAG TPA: hypothetical protein VHD35_13770 [Chitinophagaceae bacterium]|nr:hypothetical protein [Chitinophagaceae bacterium]
MKKENEKKSEGILSSIDGIQRAPAPDFFYSRLRARMEKEMPVTAIRRTILQPAFIISGLTLLLLINAIALLRSNSNVNTVTTPTKENDNLQIIATAYHINEISPEELNQ